MPTFYTTCRGYANSLWSVHLVRTKAPRVGDIRQKQRELVRETIMQALAEHVAERGLFDFSVPEIAERAGVSHRTVYNYFENRQALLDALDEWSGKTMAEAGGVNAITTLDEIPPAIEVNLRLFGEQRGVSEAFARLDPAPSSAGPAGRRRRTEMFLEAAVRELSDVDPEYARALGGLLRSMGGSRLWYALTHEYEVADDVAADVMAWAAQTVIAAARKEAGALVPDGREEPS